MTKGLVVGPERTRTKNEKFKPDQNEQNFEILRSDQDQEIFKSLDRTRT